MFRRLKYVRYADDFLIGVIGTKAECEKIKADITLFMAEKLKLEMSQEKTLITNAQYPAHFLGYDITAQRSDDHRRSKESGLQRRSFNGNITLKVSYETVLKRLQSYDAVLVTQIIVTQVYGQQTRRRHNGPIQSRTTRLLQLLLNR